MRFRRLGEPGAEIPVLVDDDRILDLRPITADIDGAFLNSRVDEARAAFYAGHLEELAGASVLRIAPPIARPGAVMCIGQNYAAHAAESGDAPPAVPILFLKHPNTVIGPYDDVIIPPNATSVDWEVELGVVIGHRARYLATLDEALACVAGLVVSNDVSERDFQIRQSGGQWSKGKTAETFNPLGPDLVTLDDIDPQALRLWSRVNGEQRQDSTTADMIFTIAEIVQHLSQYAVLEPGDLINTGTPQGVALSGRFPYLRAGDVVELGIDKLGVQRQRMIPGDQ